MERPDPRLDALLTEEIPEAGETLFRILVEQVPAVVYVDTHEPSPQTLYVSPQVEDLTGRRPAQIMADPSLWRKTVHPVDLPQVDEEWERAFASEERFHIEYRVIRADGTVAWIRDHAVVLRDADGTALNWLGVMYDITDSKDAEEILRGSEARHRALVENIPAVIYVVAPDDDRKTIYVSPQVEVALGYSQQEWLEQPDIWMELLHPDDREPTLAAHDLANETGHPWSREYRLIAADGRAVWFRDVATLVRGEDGYPRYWQGIQLDITELKEAEEELRRARDELEFRVLERTHELEEANEMMALEIGERRRVEGELRRAEADYRQVAERIPAVTYVWRVDQKPDENVYTSPQIERLLGFTPEEWSDPELWISRIHPDDRQRVLAATLRSSTTGEPFSMEFRYLAKDGHIVWVWDEAALLDRDERGRPRTFHGVLLDITKRKEAEAQASRSDQRFRALAEHIPAVIYSTDLHPELPDVSEPYVSPQIEDMLGYTPDEWLSAPDFWVQAVHPDDRERVLEAARRIERSGDAWSLEYRVMTKDGRAVWVNDRGRPLETDDAGLPRTVQGVLLDVTPRKRAEQELRDAERSYRMLVEQLPAVTYIELPAGEPSGPPHLVYISRQCERVLGYGPDELLTDPSLLVRMVHPQDRDRVSELNARTRQSGETFDAEFRIQTKDGRLVWVHRRAELAVDEEGSPLFWHGVTVDISAQRSAQERADDLQRRLQQAMSGARDSRGPDPA